MQNDPIVEEMRKNGQDFAARHHHDLAAIFKALKETERSLERTVVQRSPRPLPNSGSTGLDTMAGWVDPADQAVKTL